MIKYKLSKEWIEQNSEMIKRAYGIAQVNKWDIRSKAVVLELLRVVDPENTNEENAEIFAKVLQLFDLRLKKTKLSEKGLEDLN